MNKSLINNFTKKFDLSLIDNTQNIVEITVLEECYDYSNIYYNISYRFDKLPTFMLEHKDNNSPILKNNLTESMIKYLLMDYDEMKKNIGEINPKLYKVFIMKSLCNFWNINTV